jgi:ATP-dependent Lon protease
LDETKELIVGLKDGKEREFKKLREKCDEEVRRETDKYQFEYDKLRDEIQMFQRRLGQEESLNKQLGSLNHKMQQNMGELRNQYNIEVNEERLDILAGVQG